MRVLIDTHVFLWFIAGDDRLSQRVRHMIETPDNEILLSIASVWEIAIKTSIGKLTMSKPFDERRWSSFRPSPPIQIGG